MDNYSISIPIEECGYCKNCHEHGIEKRACFKIRNIQDEILHYCAKCYLWSVLNLYMSPEGFSEEHITTTALTIINNIGHDSMKEVVTSFIQLDIVNMDKLQEYLGKFNKTWDGTNIVTKVNE